MQHENHGRPKEIRLSSGRNPLDWIFVLRPVLHPPVWTILILGYCKSPLKPESILGLVWLLLLSSGAAGWAYMINQISDIETDRRNQKLFFLPLGLISSRAALIYAVFLCLASLTGAVLIGLRIAIVALALIVLGYLYSGKPFYGKNNAVLGTMLNALGHGTLTFILGYVGAGGFFGDAFLFSLPYFFAVIAVYIGTTLPDIEGDSLAAKKTPGVVLGTRFSLAVMMLSLITALLLSLILRDIPMLIVCNLSMPFFIYAALRPEVKNAVFAVRISVLFLSLAACVFFPWYALCLSFLFVTARLYYEKRFGIKYPSLTL